MKLNGFLMSYDMDVARIDDGHITDILCSPLLPLYFHHSRDIEKWLCARAIDAHRPNARILKKVLRLSDISDLASVLKVHAVSIPDNYWIRTDREEDLSWDDVKFSEDTFAEIALTGQFSSYDRPFTETELSKGSPELTNTGSFEKCWRLENGSWWMYKAGNIKERFSEIFISRLGEMLGFSMASYLPAGQYVKTPDFTKGILNYEPAASLSGENEDYAVNFDLLTSLDQSLGKQYLDILYMDALVFNMDRHTANFGILREQGSGHVVSMAPNFDNNIALIARGYGRDALHTSPLLIDLFLELLSQRALQYTAPVISECELREIAADTLPEEDIDREYVIRMVLARQARLQEKL